MTEDIMSDDRRESRKGGNAEAIRPRRAPLSDATNRSIVGAEGPTNFMWHVYILKCSDDSLYTGVTNDLPGRIKRHNQRRGGAYTRSRAPVTLIYSEECTTKTQALKREIEIKDLSREKKLTIINR